MAVKPKESRLVKNQKQLSGNKRDMRKKFVKSTTPTSDLKRPVVKKQLGGNIFSTYNSIGEYVPPTFDFSPPEIETEILVNPIKRRQEKVVEKASEKKEDVKKEDTPITDVKTDNVEKTDTVTETSPQVTASKGLDSFNKAYDEVEKSNPEAKKYRQFLTKMAEQESGFDSVIQNRAGAPAYGYFQFMQDDKKYNNIKQYAGTDIETFRSNPKLQIEAAIKLAKSFENGFSKEDLELAKQKGYSTWGLLGGAWLAGNGGVRRFLRGRGNPSDRHWSKEGKGTDVASRIKLFNFKDEIPKAQEGFKINWKPDRPSVDVAKTVKEYGPSFASMILTGNPSSFINKILEGKKPSLDYTHKFGSTDNKFQEFASVMTPIFKEALEKNGYPLTNLNNIVRQAALESSYGLDPRGERGFNLGGIKHPGDSIAPKYKKTKHTDGEYYIDFDNLGDYASYKVKLLNDRYNALDARNTNDFIDRLHGNNPNKSNYSADKKSYLRNLNGTKSLDKFLRRGGVIKYQNPSSGIQRRDAIKDYTPQVPFNKMKWINTPIQQPVLSQDNRSKWQHEQASKQADKGYNEYMEAKKTEQGLDRLNQFATFTDYAGLATGIGGLLGKGVKYAGKQAMKKRLLNAANSTSSAASTPKFSISKEVLPNYAKSNWQGDELALTKDRLANGGFDRLQALKGNQSKIAELQKRYGLNPRDYDYSYDDFSPEGRKALLEAQPRYGKAADFGETPDMGGLTERTKGYFTSLFDDAANRTPANITATEAHEYSHFVFDPNKLPPMDAYDFNKIPEKFKKYYMGNLVDKNRGMEITARGTQIKNYFGLKEGQPITEDMLKYAAENYVKDRGVDNGMNIFFGGIKDYKKMADWLTKWSPAIATPIIGNKMINDNDKIK